MAKTRVVLVKVHPQAIASTILNKVRETINLLGGVENFCHKNNTVLLKPNISSSGALYCTNPSVTWAVAKTFSEYGCKVLIGDDPVIPTKEEIAYTEYSLYALAEQAKAKVVSLRYGPHSKAKVPGGGFFSEIQLSSFAIEADLVVSVAAMKSINITTVSLGLKNMKGLVKSSWKRKFHSGNLNQGIVDLNKIVKQRLTVIDATFGKDTSARVCYPVGLLIASRDPVAADAVCTRIMGFDPEKIEHIRFAQEAGLGTLDMENIDIVGERIENWTGKFCFSSPKNPFELVKKAGGKIKIIQGNPCSACLNELGESLALWENQLEDFKDLIILVGPKAKPHVSCRHVILFGNCLKKYKDKGVYVAGCPPTEYGPAKTDSLKKVLTKILDKRERNRIELAKDS